MKESAILEVAAILAEWNSLGERANNIADLAGYRTEAIDIISAIAVFGKNRSINELVADVLNQGFDLNLGPADCQFVALKIKKAVSGVR